MNGTSTAGGSSGMNGAGAGMNGAGQSEHSTQTSTAGAAGTTADTGRQSVAAQTAQASAPDKAAAADARKSAEDSVASPAAHFNSEPGALAPQAVSAMQAVGALQAAPSAAVSNVPSLATLSINAVPTDAPRVAQVSVPALNVPSFAAVAQSISQQVSQLSVQQRTALSGLTQHPASPPAALQATDVTSLASLAVGALRNPAVAHNPAVTLGSVSLAAFSEALKSPPSITMAPDVKVDGSLHIKKSPGFGDSVDAFNASLVTQFGGPISVAANVSTDLKNLSLTGKLNLGPLNFTGTTNLLNGQSSIGLGAKLGNVSVTGGYSFTEQKYSAVLGYDNGPYHAEFDWSGGPQKHPTLAVKASIGFKF